MQPELGRDTLFNHNSFLGVCWHGVSSEVSLHFSMSIYFRNLVVKNLLFILMKKSGHCTITSFWNWSDNLPLHALAFLWYFLMLIFIISILFLINIRKKLFSVQLFIIVKKKLSFTKLAKPGHSLSQNLYVISTCYSSYMSFSLKANDHSWTSIED